MRFLRRRLISVVLTGIMLVSGTAALAETASDWVETEQSRIRLISKFDGVKGHDAVRIGLQVQLAPGWKIYWRSPGDAGIPPQFDWTGSTNFTQGRVFWPLPELFDAYGLSSWGYHDEVVFPITVRLSEPDKPLDLKLLLRFGICEQVCIPYEHQLSLKLDVDSGLISPESPIIEKFASRVPPQIGSKESVITRVQAEALENNNFTVTAMSNAAFLKPDIIVEGKAGAYFSARSSTISSDGRTVTFDIQADLPGKLDRVSGQTITVTMFDREFAGEGTLTVQ